MTPKRVNMWQHKGKMVDLSKKLPQAFEWTFFQVS